MPIAYKRVPAIDKCFAILDLLAKSEKPCGISEIAKQLDLTKSTVFNIIYTLVDLHVLENTSDGKFVGGSRLYTLASRGSKLIQIVHPYLESVNRKTGLSAFLGIRSNLRAILIDKVDSANRINISSEIGMQMPVLAGAAIKAMLAQLDDGEIGKLIAGSPLKAFTSNSIVDRELYKKEIRKIREEGIACDIEEYIEGLVAVAAPIRSGRRGLQAAIWVIGLTRQIPGEAMAEVSTLLKETAEEINCRLT